MTVLGLALIKSYGINPFKDAEVITVQSPEMVANMRVGNMDDFRVAEPLNHCAIVDKHHRHHHPEHLRLKERIPCFPSL